MASPPFPTDEARIEQLLEVERRLEARLREVEQQASARVEQARADLQAERSRRREALVEQGAAEARTAATAHAVALADVERQAAAQVRALQSASAELVDRLAGEALAAALEGSP